MKAWLAIALVAVVIVVTLTLSRVRPARTPEPRGVPVADLARGEPMPRIGLIGPFPSWAPLPNEGLVTGAELFRPQPPYGPAAVAMISIGSSFNTFEAAYRRRLDERGFAMKAIPIQRNLIIDRPVAQFEADERQGGHVVYITFRGDVRVRYVQLTFWAPPAPRIPS
jgi:hypothetical protein